MHDYFKIINHVFDICQTSLYLFWQKIYTDTQYNILLGLLNKPNRIIVSIVGEGGGGPQAVDNIFVFCRASTLVMQWLQAMTESRSSASTWSLTFEPLDLCLILYFAVNFS